MGACLSKPSADAAGTPDAAPATAATAEQPQQADGRAATFAKQASAAAHRASAAAQRAIHEVKHAAATTVARSQLASAVKKGDAQTVQTLLAGAAGDLFQDGAGPKSGVRVVERAGERCLGRVACISPLAEPDLEGGMAWRWAFRHLSPTPLSSAPPLPCFPLPCPAEERPLPATQGLQALPCACSCAAAAPRQGLGARQGKMGGRGRHTFTACL